MSAFNVSLRLELCGGVSLPAVLSKYWGQVNVLAHFARSKKIETVETHHRSILPLIKDKKVFYKRPLFIKKKRLKD